MGDLFLPRLCVVCGGRLAADERFLCPDCAGDIPHTYFWDLAYNPAADSLNEIIQHRILKERFPNGGPAEGAGLYEPYSRFAALFFYDSDNGYRHICHRLKYGGDTALGRHYSRLFGERLAGSPLFSDVDLVVPVPLHWTRRWKRGYNQAEVISGELASCLGARHCPRLLLRRRRTETQTVLSIEEKKRNVEGAFMVNSAALSRLKPLRGENCKESRRKGFLKKAIQKTRSGDGAEEWRPRHILIVDDVMTTGATLAACHSALREVFPPHVRISAAALACVPK